MNHLNSKGIALMVLGLHDTKDKINNDLLPRPYHSGCPDGDLTEALEKAAQAIEDHLNRLKLQMSIEETEKGGSQ
jgi:hypothetical protein